VRPQPPHQVAHVTDAAGRGEAHGQVEGLPADGAGSFRLVLGGTGGGEQGQVEGPAADVAAIHVEGTARVPGGVGARLFP